ncbi:acyl-CoA carboxylase epsilon subunit [Sphaerisporangium sp. TRM90804]|uniref:acyl-CoA carboxylase epsilon subunit n=1 Tax=Sphaerisporangium sp. TRM90804 TaxID=3031113 RepID=UPI00244A40D9|nr:acyl-CoA carboxylase epsilon subunit [Sphaerisporangium sp. TRM90804]MDH2428362.1 acyl-CoA carboxylase epsilon subunit [Sphaerisporangium sp. TRM90804]
MAEIPFLKVVRGNPTAEELAALIAVLAARAAEPADTPAPASPAAWSDSGLIVRRPLPPRAWRSSGWSA